MGIWFQPGSNPMVGRFLAQSTLMGHSGGTNKPYYPVMAGNKRPVSANKWLISTEKSPISGLLTDSGPKWDRLGLVWVVLHHQLTLVDLLILVQAAVILFVRARGGAVSNRCTLMARKPLPRRVRNPSDSSAGQWPGKSALPCDTGVSTRPPASWPDRCGHCVAGLALFITEGVKFTPKFIFQCSTQPILDELTDYTE